MPDRIALKRLTPSDLTFFDAQWRQLGVGNQKSINLNADPFSTRLYPGLAARARGSDVEIPIIVTILGPSRAGAYRVPRSVTKKAAYRNWRLNGAAVPDPPAEMGRFDALVPGDIAVLEFMGESQPEAVTLIIVSRSADPALHERLDGVIPGERQTMIAVTRDVLRALAGEASVPADHPIHVLLEDPEVEAELEDAAFGSVPAVARLRRRSGAQVTAAALAAARANAEAIGADGEALAWIHLSALKAAGELSDVVWMSRVDAAAPWDFEAVLPSGSIVRIEVKSTTGPFERTIHISAAEMVAAADGSVRYDIWRIYDLGEDGGKLRIANDIAGFAQTVSSRMQLPPGVRPDGFSVDPQAIPAWHSVQDIARPDDPA
jgi:hypothetical protein